MSNKPTFIVDLDDTLVYCGQYYDDCKNRFADYMEQFGLGREDCLRRFAHIDIERAKDTKIDFESRFPGSMVHLYRLWSLEKKLEVIPEHEVEVTKIGYSVYENMFSLMPDAHNMLYELSNDFDMYLYTKGNEERQIKKILKANLDTYFNGVWITDQKTLKNLTIFMLKYELRTSSTWVLGNSPKSDIVPAIEIGIPIHQCILIDSYTWEEDIALLPAGIHIVKSLGEVVPITKKLVALGSTNDAMV